MKQQILFLCKLINQSKRESSLKTGIFFFSSRANTWSSFPQLCFSTHHLNPFQKVNHLPTLLWADVGSSQGSQWSTCIHLACIVKCISVTHSVLIIIRANVALMRGNHGVAHAYLQPTSTLFKGKLSLQLESSQSSFQLVRPLWSGIISAMLSP